MYKNNLSPDRLSYSAFPLKIYPIDSENHLAVGTGFLYEHENQLYLITNGHNVTGVDPLADNRLSKSIALPNRLQMMVRTLIDNSTRLRVIAAYCNLYEDEEQVLPRWFVHPTHGYKVDVVAIPIGSIDEISQNFESFPINRYHHDGGYSLEAADDVFILGFPYGIEGGKLFPIWKKGSIASEPSIDFDGLPKFLVDSASRPGMSGAPVIFQRSGIHNLENGEITDKTSIGRIRDFVGIYSGRVTAPDPLDAQLGVVWKKVVIDEILSGKIKGDLGFQMLYGVRNSK